MIQLIEESIALIHDRPEESKLIHHILTEWDDEMKQAFIMAWRILNEK